MASLFDYNRMIEEIITNNTDEDGVISDDVVAELDALELEREEKINNCISYIKSRRAMAEMLKTEKMALARRQQIAENEAERIKDYLTFCLNGTKWESTAGKVSYRKSEAVEIEDLGLLPEEFIKTKIEADKTAIKAAIKEGQDVPGAHLEEKTSTVIK